MARDDGDVEKVRQLIRLHIRDVILDCDLTAARVVDARSRVGELCGHDLHPFASLFRDELRESLAEISAEQRGIANAEVVASAEAATGKPRAFSGPPRILSPDFAALTGQPMMAWADALAWLRDYAKSHSLQNPARKSEIVFDDALQRVFKRKKATYFQLSALLRNVCKSADDVVCGATAGSERKAHARPNRRRDDGVEEGLQLEGGEECGEEAGEEAGEEGDDDHDEDDDEAAEERSVATECENGPTGRRKRAAAPAPKGVPAKKARSSGGGGGFGAMVVLSDKLGAVLGATEMRRTEVVKRMWAYVKQHELQNPAMKSEFVLDAALRGVFGVDKMTMFSMNKLLTAHLWPKAPA